MATNIIPEFSKSYNKSITVMTVKKKIKKIWVK